MPEAANKFEKEVPNIMTSHLRMETKYKRAKGLVNPTAGDGGFVTIHDFISTVHPYLMTRRAEVLEP